MQLCRNVAGRPTLPAEALYRPTVDELIVHFTDLRTRQAVIETVEHTVLSVCACERAKLVSVSSPRRVSRNSEINRRQTDATQAPSDPGQSSNVPLLALPDAGGESGKTLFRLTQQAIRRALRGAGVDSLRPEQIDSPVQWESGVVDSNIQCAEPVRVWLGGFGSGALREQVIGVFCGVAQTARTTLQQSRSGTAAHHRASKRRWPRKCHCTGRTLTNYGARTQCPPERLDLRDLSPLPKSPTKFVFRSTSFPHAGRTSERLASGKAAVRNTTGGRPRHRSRGSCTA